MSLMDSGRLNRERIEGEIRQLREFLDLLSDEALVDRMLRQQLETDIKKLQDKLGTVAEE